MKIVKAPKTEVTWEVPVHPVLAQVLAAWKHRGWEKHFGRAPDRG